MYAVAPKVKSVDGSVIVWGSMSYRNTGLLIHNDFGPNVQGSNQMLHGTSLFLKSFAVSSRGHLWTAATSILQYDSAISHRVCKVSERQQDDVLLLLLLFGLISTVVFIINHLKICSSC